MKSKDVRLLDELERTLRQGGLRLVYQPKVDAADGRLVRVEALVRWTHSDLGAIPPDPLHPAWPSSMA